MPPRLRRTGAHEKTNTHAAGLAPPGKRVVKQRSNGALDSEHASNGCPTPAVSAHQLDAGSGHLTHTTIPSPTSDEAAVNDLSSDAKMGASQSTHDGGDRTASQSSDDDLEAHGSGCGNGHHVGNGSPLKIDVKSGTTNMGPKVTFSNHKTPFAIATTILKACPLWDVIAILIILLQLPPTIISIVQFLFAFLTFVSPISGSASIANMPTLNDVLMGVSGAPSFQTVVFLDVLMLLPFIFLWTPAQNVALDLAQAVIAISLGGAASSTGGASASVLSCVVIIGLSHLVRWDFARQLGFNFVWIGLVKSGLQTDSAPPMLPRYPDRLNASHGWPRKLVGVHILAQGVTRLVRRWYLSNEMAANKKTDADGSSLSAINTPRTTTFAESHIEPASSNSTDGRPPGPSPAPVKEDAASRNKRKKKQANFVRSAQPFWAALANAKVTFLKELEHQQASSDAMEANAQDVGNIGNVNFQSGRDRVWIKEVGHSEISFGVSLASLAPLDKDEDGQDSDQCIKRFRVRLNKTDWSSTRITQQSLGVQAGEELVDAWTGKIFGLTASTNYICEFVKVDDGSIVFTTHITTQPAPFAEHTPAPSAQPSSLRPLSPTTTLRNSIQAAEAKLEAYRNKLRRNKREHKTIVTGLQKEVDSLNGRLTSNNGNDDRMRQKVRQLEQNLQQAKVKEEEIAAEVDSAVDVPADERQEYNKRRADWQREKKRRADAQREFDAVKTEADREVAQLKNEIASVLAKRQKFEQRKSKFTEQRDKLLSEANESQEAQSRRYQEREIEARNRVDVERRFMEQTAGLEREAQGVWAKGGQYENHARQMEELYNMNMQQQSMPTTPEGPLPGTRAPAQGIRHHNTFPALQPGFQFSNAQAGFPDPMMMPGNRNSDNMFSLYREGRGRSSSMLSGMSSFTDDLDNENPLPMHHQYAYQQSSAGVIGNGSRKSSAGTGSTSTGSNSSSTKDPMSPPPKILTPIGKSFASPISPPPPSTSMR